MEPPTPDVIAQVSQGIPSSVWQTLILSELSCYDLLRVARVCKTWYGWARSNCVFARHVNRVIAIAPEIANVFKPVRLQQETTFGRQVTSYPRGSASEPKQKRRKPNKTMANKLHWYTPGHWRIFAGLLNPHNSTLYRANFMLRYFFPAEMFDIIMRPKLEQWDTHIFESRIVEIGENPRRILIRIDYINVRDQIELNYDGMCTLRMSITQFYTYWLQDVQFKERWNNICPAYATTKGQLNQIIIRRLNE